MSCDKRNSVKPEIEVEYLKQKTRYFVTAQCDSKPAGYEYEEVDANKANRFNSYAGSRRKWIYRKIIGCRDAKRPIVGVDHEDEEHCYDAQQFDVA